MSSHNRMVNMTTIFDISTLPRSFVGVSTLSLYISFIMSVIVKCDSPWELVPWDLFLAWDVIWLLVAFPSISIQFALRFSRVTAKTARLRVTDEVTKKWSKIFHNYHLTRWMMIWTSLKVSTAGSTFLSRIRTVSFCFSIPSLYNIHHIVSSTKLNNNYYVCFYKKIAFLAIDYMVTSSWTVLVVLQVTRKIIFMTLRSICFPLIWLQRLIFATLPHLRKCALY